MFVKLIIFCLIVFVSRKNETIALVATIALMMTLISLNSLKANEEMTDIISEEKSSKHNIKIGSCDCVCDDFEKIKPKTDDGKLVFKEVMNAISNGVLSKEKAKSLIISAMIAENKNQPVLVPTTETGEIRMEEIADLAKNGAINSEDAKKSAAVIIVAEAVVKENQESKQAIANVATVATNVAANIAATAATVAEEIPIIKNININGSIAEMAKEVKKRKKIETIKNGGTELSEYSIKQLCIDVLNDYKKISPCKEMPESIDTNGDFMDEFTDVSGIDPSASSYAPAGREF
jgi:hypothetical protein